MPGSIKLCGFNAADVKLLNPYECNAFSKELAYLRLLDADRLLKGFCDIGGVKSDAVQYGGWETSAIQGHTLGHYLTALSQAYAACGEKDLRDTVSHVVSVLAKCQNPDTGYLAAIPESHYDVIESGSTAGTWVPWYNTHKLLSGLIAAYEMTGNQQALSVAAKLGDWAYSRTSHWDEKMQATVLHVEYGGMNDCLYQLYQHTGDEHHLSAAHSFDEIPLLDALDRGEDVLNGKHANTTIPKIVGALNRYITLGESEAFYLRAAENFFSMVTKHHSYITGGNSEWEHFGEPDVLAAERTNCNCETCNTYNMLKLARGLFQVTGGRQYADYYANTFVNAILSSQNPDTGMTMYFQPMATGYFKVYSSADKHFWCCTGTGMENFSKLGDSIYFHDDHALYVIRYTSSRVVWREKGITLTQTTDLPVSDKVQFTVTADEGAADVSIMLHVPDWCAGKPNVSVNGKVVRTIEKDGFLPLNGPWSNGDVIEYTLPVQVAASCLPDNPHVVAFRYGPVVLSAAMGTQDMTRGTTGVDVTIPLTNADLSDVITLTDTTVEQWLAHISDNLVRCGDSLRFTLRGTDANWVFVPHYMQHQERYGIYFELLDQSAASGADQAERYVVVDSLPVANDQYEFSHNLQARGSSTGIYQGHNYRDAAPGGYFSYDLAVKRDVVNYLKVTYCARDAGRSFDLRVNGRLLENVALQENGTETFYDRYYALPSDLIDGKEKICISFEAHQDSAAGGVFNLVSIVYKA